MRKYWNGSAMVPASNVKYWQDGDIDESCVLYLIQASGTALTDFSPKNQTSTNYNVTVGDGLVFNGSDAYINLGSSTDYDAENFTIEFYGSCDDVPDGKAPNVFSKWATDGKCNCDLQFEKLASTGLRKDISFYLSTTPYTDDVIRYTNFTYGQKYYIVATGENVGSTYYMRLYVDSILIGTNTYSGKTRITAPGADAYAGASDYWTGSTPALTLSPYFDGQMNLLAFYSRALQQKDVSKRYANISRIITENAQAGFKPATNLKYYDGTFKNS